MVGHMLGSSVRKEDRVGALHVPVSVRDLSSVEVGSMIIIVNTILVLVGTWFLLVDRGRGMVIGRGWSVVGGVTNHPAGNTEDREEV